MDKNKKINIIINRLEENRKFIQVLMGPRQVGKTTLVNEVLSRISQFSIYRSADEPMLKPDSWIEENWELARIEARKKGEVVLVLDEIQKLPHWSETVKKLWDEDTFSKIKLKVILLGSSPLLVQRGLTESLAGRFEVIHLRHWDYLEMKEVFGWDLETYLFFGGYPGAAGLIEDEERWRRYILDSLVETSVSRDILLMNRIDKPALLRRLFQLGCEYSSQILSYQKMTGQLQDAGNTTTLSHYLELLSGAGLIMGLNKYAGEKVRRRASSPKLLVLNTALMNSISRISFDQAKKDAEYWGRVVESSVGAYLVNLLVPIGGEVYYWRERNREVDFVIELDKKIIAIEVKSSIKKINLSGMDAFKKEFHPQKVLQVGGRGIEIERFFHYSVEDLFN